MDITAHIRELLFGHDCVILPGFGGFIGNYSPARIDKSTGTFFPPVKKISFNRNLNHNDGLLIKKISEGTSINYGDARDMITGFVADLKRKLERGEKIVFEHIGTFMNNHEGNVQFEPFQDVNYYLDSYGFEPFQCMPLEGYDVRRKISAVNTRASVRSIRKYLWRAAVIIPAASIIVAVSLRPDLFKAKVDTTSLNPLAAAELQSNLVADSIAQPSVILNAADSSKPDTVEGAPVTPVAEIITPSEPAPVITAKSSYYIITGSFQSEENAGKQVRLLQAEGFNPEVVSSGNGFYRVCAMECPDLQTAVSKKDSIITKFPGAWVSRKK